MQKLLPSSQADHREPEPGKNTFDQLSALLEKFDPESNANPLIMLQICKLSKQLLIDDKSVRMAILDELMKRDDFEEERIQFDQGLAELRRKGRGAIDEIANAKH